MPLDALALIATMALWLGAVVWRDRHPVRVDGWPRFHLFKRTFTRPGAAKAEGRSLSFHLYRRAR